MFLTPEEIVRLTGKKRNSAQCRWLLSKGYKIEVNGLGEPILAVEEYKRKNVGSSVTRKKEPNWSALRGQTTA